MSHLFIIAVIVKPFVSAGKVTENIPRHRKILFRNIERFPCCRLPYTPFSILPGEKLLRYCPAVADFLQLFSAILFCRHESYTYNLNNRLCFNGS